MKTLLSITLLAFLTSAVARGQATAQIHGTVQDASGAAVPGATVKATQTDTGISRTTTTEADGGYVLTNLPLGPYSIEVTKEGFATALQSGITLQVNSDLAVVIALKVGAVSERVTVEANASLVETRSSGVGTVIETQRILDLPLNGRQPTDLITFAGAAVQTGASPGFGMRTGVNISVAGGTVDGVQYNLDGSPHLNLFDGTSMPFPFPDALQEFKVSTSTQDASSSGHSGATVNAVTRSGTNSFHGDMFEFLRNSAVNARDFFAAGPDGLKRNQFGGTLGGPIQKDKVFFFLGYQGTTIRQTPISNTVFVPTAQELRGDFTTFASAQCQGRPITLTTPRGWVGVGFRGNQINPAEFSKAAVKIAARLPQTSDPCGRYLTGNILHENDHEVPVRLDYQLSDKQTLFARYMLVKQQTVVPYELTPNDVLTAGTNGSNGGIGSDDQFNSLTIGDTYVFSANVVNSFRVSGNRVSAIKPGASMFGPADVGINSFSYQPHYLTIPVTGAFSLGSANFSENSFAYTTAFGANDDVNIIRGSHQFAFGGYFLRSLEWSVAQAWSGGSFTINGTATNLGMSDFFLGQVAQFRQANPNPLNVNQNFFGLYAQDTWKIGRKLTMTYGVNWAPFFAMSFPQRDSYNFSLARFKAGQKSAVVPNAPPGFTYPGDTGFSGSSGIASRYGNLDPRVGIAWDPAGDGKTAIRAGAGIAHDFIRQDLHLNTSSVSPFRLTIINLGINLDNPWAGFPGGDPFPYNYNKSNPTFAAYGSYLPVPPDMRTHEQYSWNLGIQRQVTPGWFVSGTYVGTHIIHIWNAVELNPGIYIAGNCAVGQYGLTAAGPCSNTGNVNNRRLLNLTNPGTQLGYITQYDDGGTQSYNGLLLNTNWRMGRSLNVNANYTWSHCIGLQTITLLNPGANYVHSAYQNVGQANRNLDVGDCAQDRRQIFNLTLVAQTPKFSNRAMRLLASDWTFGTGYVARSGTPFTVLAGTDRALNGYSGNTPGTQRANQSLADVNAPNQGQSCPNSPPCVSWINPLAFSQPDLGTYGNMGVNNVLGPAFWEWDEAVSRQFQIREGQRLEIRAEAFNITNSFRGGLGGANGATGGGFNALNNGNFGVIRNDATPPAPTTAPARVIQFALKFVF